MYNEEMKKQYIESVNLKPDFSEDDLALTLCVFQTSEKYEEKFGKDLAYFNANEIKNVYLDFGYAKEWKNRRLQRLINKYIRYVKKEYDSSVMVPKMSIEMMNDLAIQGTSNDGFYITEEDFTSLIESLIDSYNIQMAFLLTAIYTGLKGDLWSEITLAKISNINFEKQTMQVYAYNKKDNKIYFSRTVRVNDLFLKVARLASAETEYRNSKGVIRGKYKITDFILKERVTVGEENGTIEYVSRQYKRCVAMMTRFRRNPDYAFLDLTSENIRDSGILNFLLKLMKAFDEPVSRKDEVINNPYISNPVMEKYNIDEFYLRKVILRYLK